MEPSLRSGATWESRKLTRSKNPFQAPRDFLGMEPGKACFEPRFRLESSEISEVFVSNFFLVKLVNKPVSSCASWWKSAWQYGNRIKAQKNMDLEAWWHDISTPSTLEVSGIHGNPETTTNAVELYGEGLPWLEPTNCGHSFFTSKHHHCQTDMSRPVRSASPIMLTLGYFLKSRLRRVTTACKGPFQRPLFPLKGALPSWSKQPWNLLIEAIESEPLQGSRSGRLNVVKKGIQKQCF